MADGIIKATDIIDAEGIKKALEEVRDNLDGLKGAISELAKSEKIRLSEIISTAGMEKAAERVSVLANAMENLKRFYEANAEAMRSYSNVESSTAASTKAMAEAKKAEADAEKAQLQLDRERERVSTRKKKEIEEESELIKKLRQEIEAYNGVVSKETLKAINLETASYKELSKVASVLGAALKNMSAEQKASGNVGAEMVRVTKAINEELARQDANVARYSRNVGNYRSAFDGLGYSIQQVMREVPSAINVQQFFLAISNNIPMVVDQMKLFKQEQNDIKEQLETMTAGTNEYMKLQEKQMSLGKKFLKSILSWQTAIIAALFLLRKYGADIVNWFVGLFKKVDINGYLVGTRQAMGEMYRMANESYVSATTELSVIVKRLSEVSSGTDEWRDGIKRVNEITNSNLNATTATIGEVKKVTKAYIEQARQIAKNNAIVSLLEKSNKDELSRQLASKAKSNYQLASSLGISIDSDDFKELDKLWKKRTKAKSAYTASLRSGGSQFVNMGAYTEGSFNYNVNKSISQLNKERNDAEIELKNFINSRTAGILDEKAIEKLLEQYEITLGTGKKKSGGSSKTEPQFEEMNDRYWEALEARLKILKDGYEKEESLLSLQHDKELEENEKYYESLETALLVNKENGYITEKEYGEKLKVLADQKRDEQIALEDQYQKDILALKDKYALDDIKRISENASKEQQVLKKRIKTVKDEQLRNQQIASNIIAYRNAIEDIQKIVLLTGDATKEQLEYITKLREEIAKLQAQIDHSKQISTYSSLGDMLSRNGAFETSGGTKRNILENLLGKEAYSAYEDGSKEMIAAIESDYEKWLDATESALKTWYDTTIGYVDSLIDSFVSLSEAKADAAAEDTNTAKEAYEKEKALLEAGYANRVDAAWAEYQEKKEIQKQAEQDAKNAQKVQMALDTATQASSLITAIANMYKTMSAIPGFGIVAATALSTALVGAFTASKVMAYQATKYGEGGFEVVEQGGSHASGNDTELGVMNRHGKRMVVERNEGIGVFRTRAMSRYGKRSIESLVARVNEGTIDLNAMSMVDSDRRLGMQIINSSSQVNLGNLERGVKEIAEQGKTSTYVDGNGNVIVKRGNTITKYIK